MPEDQVKERVENQEHAIPTVIPGSMRNEFNLAVNGKRYSVLITQRVHRYLQETMWDIFRTTFGPGSGANKDFANAEEFYDILAQEETLVAYALDGEEIACFAIFTRDEQIISQFAKRDYSSLLHSIPPKKAIFWVFLFCPNGPRRYFGPHAKALYTAMAMYMHERKGVAMFDEDATKKVSLYITKFLEEVGVLIAKTGIVQRLDTTLLVFEKPSENKTEADTPRQLSFEFVY
ncbi:MAG: hypothetical protein ABI747_03895 [Candidatus Moraniibacteriota bacterium]